MSKVIRFPKRPNESPSNEPDLTSLGERIDELEKGVEELDSGLEELDRSVDELQDEATNFLRSLNQTVQERRAGVRTRWIVFSLIIAALLIFIF